MKKICEFLGDYNYKEAARTVTKKLNRTKPKKLPNQKILKEVFGWIRDNNIKKVVDQREELRNITKKLVEKYERKEKVQSKPKNEQ